MTPKPSTVTEASASPRVLAGKGGGGFGALMLPALQAVTAHTEWTMSVTPTSESLLDVVTTTVTVLVPMNASKRLSGNDL